MSIESNPTGVVILAAGLGKRMKSDKLKVMHELQGRPLIDYVITAIEASGIKRQPTVVVCDNDSSVQDFLGKRAEYVVQSERLGTGHAVMQAERALKNKVDQVMVLYGDMPFVRAQSIDSLVKKHRERGNQITLMTAVADFVGWQEALKDYGRIIRGGADNHIVAIVEKKDATVEQLAINEINPGFYCFDSAWLWPHLHQLKNNNIQGEYYLTDLVGLAVSEGAKISSITVAPTEALGINTQEDLHNALALS